MKPDRADAMSCDAPDVKEIGTDKVINHQVPHQMTAQHAATTVLGSWKTPLKQYSWLGDVWV